MTRLAALALLLAPALVAQPVLPRAEDATAALRPWGEPAAHPAPSEWEPPAALYWTGVALDAAVIAGGAYLLVKGVQFYRLGTGASGGDDPTLGLGPALVTLTGIGGIVIGGGAVAVSGYDLARVLRGDAPWLARLFDPTRLPDRSRLPIPPHTPPQRPPGLPPGQ